MKSVTFGKIGSSLFAKLMLLLTAFIIIPAIVILVFFETKVTGKIETELRENLFSLVQEKRDKLATELNYMENLSRTIVNDNYVIEYLRGLEHGAAPDSAKLQRITSFLETEMQKGNGIYENMALFYKGNLLTDGIGGKSMPRSERTEDALGNLLLSHTTGRPVLSNVTVFKEEEMSTPLAIFVMAIELSKVTDRIIKNEDEHIKTIILDSQGFLVASDIYQDQLLKYNFKEQDSGTAKFFETVRATGSGTAALTWDGQEYIAAFTPDEARSLYVVNLMSVSHFTKINDDLLKWLTLLLIACVALGLLIANFAARKMICRPIKNLTDATLQIAAGDCDVQVDVKSQDEIGLLAQSFKTLVDNIRTGAAAAAQIAAGKLDVQLTVRSEKDLLNKNLNLMIENIRALVRDINTLTEAAIQGQLAVRADASQHSGEYQRIVNGINATLDAVIEPVNFAAAYIQRMADGEYVEAIEKDYRGDYKILMESLMSIRASLNNLVGETVALTRAAAAGDLTVRADLTKFKGGYADIATGFNQTLDAVIAPLNEAIAVLGRIAVNDYTTEMTGQYQGMLKQFAESVNLTRARLVSIQDAILRVAEGDISRLEEFKQIGKRSENDRMMPAMIKMYQAIQDMGLELEKLTGAAVSGDLKLRSDLTKFQGGFQRVVAGFNKTLDAMIAPITETLQVLQAVAEGNLQVSVVGDYQGDHAILKEAVNTTLAAFNNVLGEINQAAEQVAIGSKQIADSSQTLSQASTEQASTVEEISSSITELAAQTKQNAVNAGQASELAQDAKEKAIEGNEQMRAMLTAMGEINQASANIAKIIKVIDEIAFQTNILALNAAVEAARAGQYGKGFAVVAEEVRNLAARSANAAKETTELIEGSVKKVEAGTKIANKTAEALNQIVDEVTKTTALVGEIAVASNEQATGIAQINQGITQVSQVTQGNSATAEQSAAASQELSSQAQLLKAMVEKFKLKNELPGPEAAKPDPKGQVGQLPERAKNKRIALDDQDFGKY